MGGDGPRRTPTFHAGRLYTQGANGLLNCLDAASGKLLWSHDIAAECKAEVPHWGFAGSPLVTQGLVVVFASAPKEDPVTYKEEKGELAWTAAWGRNPTKPPRASSSPQLATFDGVEQILFVTDAGLSGHQGRPQGPSCRIMLRAVQARADVQPALVGDGDVLIGTGMGQWHAAGSCSPATAMPGSLTPYGRGKTSIRPYFNDFVVLDDYLYGFDTNKFLCISLKDGSEAWHATGYGSGQVLLLADRRIAADRRRKRRSGTGFRPAGQARGTLQDSVHSGRQNLDHPVIAHGNLYVRNGEEIACFKLGMPEEKSATERPQRPDPNPSDHAPRR